jgi:hypothetical protein
LSFIAFVDDCKQCQSLVNQWRVAAHVHVTGRVDHSSQWPLSQTKVCWSLTADHFSKPNEIEREFALQQMCATLKSTIMIVGWLHRCKISLRFRTAGTATLCDLAVSVIQLIYLAAAVVTSFVGMTGRCGLIFIRVGTLPIAHRRRRTFGCCVKRMNASSYEVRLVFVLSHWLMWLVCNSEQELVVHLEYSRVRKIALAVEPRQSALNVLFVWCQKQHFVDSML